MMKWLCTTELLTWGQATVSELDDDDISVVFKAKDKDPWSSVKTERGGVELKQSLKVWTTLPLIHRK